MNNIIIITLLELEKKRTKKEEGKNQGSWALEEYQRLHI